jgi:hypothetical protein
MAVALRDHRLNGDVDIAAPAALIGDAARAAMLLALSGGEPRVSGLGWLKPERASGTASPGSY